MNDIFISYKVHNRKRAIEYYKTLKEKGLVVWFDQLVPQGADWKKTIDSQIQNSKLVFCLLSQYCLLDDWVLFQLTAARKYQKEIIFICLDDTAWEEHIEYAVGGAVYHQFEEIPFEQYLLYSKEINQELHLNEPLENESVEESVKEEIAIDPPLLNQDRGALPKEEVLNDQIKDTQPKPKHILLPVFNIGSMVIFSCIGLLVGLDFFNVSLDHRYGFVLIAITILLLLSYIHKKVIFILQAILAITTLCLTIYIVPPYYISSISINAIFFMIFYFFAFTIRYIGNKIWLGLLKAIGYTVLFSSLVATIIIFVNHFWDYDCSWISIVFLSLFLIYKYWSLRNEFK
ncbi:MAG: toll/interleukin-1 receptor domain-containing protein [Roseburia sp.]|nr:toll/interleukin-1 receptor domain-containing protein [Anaeroplasma bactoclasticum]MCM1195757.1 toll/interleukin-1 receptor domain-containing protein [Roseburia sp.]MCM1556982.1 toll/interleukin-1 receptor domain-containing protein [Anaeroplasma bactoclasticum]